MDSGRSSAVRHVLCEKPFSANAAEAREIPTGGEVGPVVMRHFTTATSAG